MWKPLLHELLFIHHLRVYCSWIWIWYINCKRISFDSRRYGLLHQQTKNQQKQIKLLRFVLLLHIIHSFKRGRFQFVVDILVWHFTNNNLLIFDEIPMEKRLAHFVVNPSTIICRDCIIWYKIEEWSERQKSTKIMNVLISFVLCVSVFLTSQISIQPTIKWWW